MKVEIPNWCNQIEKGLKVKQRVEDVKQQRELFFKRYLYEQ